MNKIKSNNMSNKSKIGLAFIISLLTFSSCKTYTKLPYLNNDGGKQAFLHYPMNGHEARVMPHDIITITVNSTIRESVADFNLPLVPASMNQAIQTSVNSGSSTGSIQNYLVDREGKIEFPVLGMIKIGGMTLSEVKDTIAAMIYPRYITERPVVNVRFTDFSVSVLGEVKNPGVYASKNGMMTVFDAIAAAGDLSIYGKRNNVMLMRHNSDGSVDTYRINLQSTDIMSDEKFFFLQQNDKLYIEPNRARGNSSAFGTFESIGLSAGLSAISIIVSLVSILTR